MRLFTLSSLRNLCVRLDFSTDSPNALQPILNAYLFRRRHNLVPINEDSCIRLVRVNSEQRDDFLLESFQCDEINCEDSAPAYLALRIENAKGLQLSAISPDSSC